MTELLAALDDAGARRALALRLLARAREVAGPLPDLSPLVDPSPYPRLTPRRRRAARRAVLKVARRRAQERAQEIAARLDADRRGAERDLRRLLDFDAAERPERVKAARRRFASPVLVELLLEEARAALRLDRDATVELLDLAEQVAHRVSRERYGRGLVDRLLSRVAGHRANALRVAGDLPGAEAIWQGLRARLRVRPANDPAVEAELASLEASLRQDQRRFPEAEALLAVAAAGFRRAGDGEGEVKVLIKQGATCFFRGEPSAALPFFHEAAAAVDPERSPRRFLETQHNLAVCLGQLGRNEEAADVLKACGDFYAQFPEPWTQLLLAWLEGRIAAGRGDGKAAERLLLEARNGYLGEELPFDASLVTLDLTELYLRQGRTVEVQRLARATVEVFAGQEVYAEAARALALFHQAAATERLTPRLLARLRAYFERARLDPTLPFDPAV